tara:strand:- start:374 stop:1165 length:792 start_codon:yes stop_codon:yes gene_type:complete
MEFNSLNKIIIKKKEKLDLLKNKLKVEDLKYKIDKIDKFLDFKQKIYSNYSNGKFSIIAEIKQASPSAGNIIKDYDPVTIAEIYEKNRATCLSVLTEEDFFNGRLDHISKIKEKINLPILCKDFFIDKFQIPLAKSFGADAILLIVAALNQNQLEELYKTALEYKMSVIIEVHTIEEAKRITSFKNAIIGINNRNLKTLKTDLNNTFKIYKALNNFDGILISESGIKNKDDILKISNQTNIKTFLIGESLLKNLDSNSIFSIL